MRNSLRMRPDRIIVGEVRGAEARDMMTAMNLGKYCMCTIHAASTQEAFARLENFPMNVPSALINLIDILVVVHKFPKEGSVKRVIREVSETSFMEAKRPLVSKLWDYNFDTNMLEAISDFTIFREKLSSFSGKTLIDIIEELELRSNLLFIMHHRDKSSYTEVSKMASIYNKNKQDLMDYLSLKEEEIKSISMTDLRLKLDS